MMDYDRISGLFYIPEFIENYFPTLKCLLFANDDILELSISPRGTTLKIQYLYHLDVKDYEEEIATLKTVFIHDYEENPTLFKMIHDTMEHVLGHKIIDDDFGEWKVERVSSTITHETLFAAYIKGKETCFLGVQQLPEWWAKKTMAEKRKEWFLFKKQRTVETRLFNFYDFLSQSEIVQFPQFCLDKITFAEFYKYHDKLYDIVFSGNPIIDYHEKREGDENETV